MIDLRLERVHIVTLIALVAVISTVFATDKVLFHGVITAKYFWFAVAISVVSLFMPFSISRKNEIHVADILFGVFSVYVCFNYFCLNSHPDMHWWLTLLIFPLYIAVRSLSGNEMFRRLLVVAFLLVVFVQAIWGLMQLYGFLSSWHAFYKITGGFFNPGPYSGFVATGVPLALHYLFDKTASRWERWLSVGVLAASFLILPAAMSRAAWIAAFVGCIFVLWKCFESSSFKLMIIVAGLIALVMLSGAYFLKKDSADGRIVIWSASMEAIKERPFFGAGYGKFTTVYGDAQAEYFLKKERKPAQIMVADSPEYAFNEYLQITVELGIVGLLLFLSLIVSCFVNLRSLTAVHYPLTAILIFAVFSYPFSVLPLAILFVFLMGLIAPYSKKISFNLPVWLQILGITLCLAITAYGAYQIIAKRAAYLEWSELQTNDNYMQATEQFASLYPHLRHNKIFLFQYGQSLSQTGQHAESNRLYEEYLNYGSDPMVYNCMGNNFKEMEQYVQAEKMYIRALQIVPNRHYPLYLLMKLYMDTGEIEKAKIMAKLLLEKPVKVQSSAIREMQEEARELRIEN